MGVQVRLFLLVLYLVNYDHLLFSVMITTKSSPLLPQGGTECCFPFPGWGMKSAHGGAGLKNELWQTRFPFSRSLLTWAKAEPHWGLLLPVPLTLLPPAGLPFTGHGTNSQLIALFSHWPNFLLGGKSLFPRSCGPRLRGHVQTIWALHVQVNHYALCTSAENLTDVHFENSFNNPVK